MSDIKVISAKDFKERAEGRVRPDVQACTCPVPGACVRCL